MKKQFLEWIGLKEKIHQKNTKPPRVNEGDIWWASIGENVGWEINGKSRKLSRPVIIFKKLTHGFYLVIPTSTQKKEGTWYVSFYHKKMYETACIHQIRTIDHRRLWSRIGELDSADLLRIKEGFQRLYVP